MTTNAAPPGWHPDPSNPGGAMRWWDGLTWTLHTQQAQQGGQAAASAPRTWPSASPVTTGGYQPSGYAPAGTPVSGYPAGSYAAAGFPTGGLPAGGGYPAGAYRQPQQLSFAKQNSLSLIAIGLVGLYIVIALSSRVVFFGIAPVMLSIRALNRKESLAPFAVAAAVVAVGVAFLALK